MTQLINTQLESLISMQKVQMGYSAEGKDFQSANSASENGISEELKAVADQFEAIFLEMLLAFESTSTPLSSNETRAHKRPKRPWLSCVGAFT